jgi:hypothetical protein
MAKLKRTIGRRAARAAVRHSAHGVSAKVQRKPVRSASLISLGAIVGAAAAFLAGRRTAS